MQNRKWKKWKVRLRHKEIVGAVHKDRSWIQKQICVFFFSKASNNGKQEMVINDITDNEEQIRVTKVSSSGTTCEMDHMGRG